MKLSSISRVIGDGGDESQTQAVTKAILCLKYGGACTVQRATIHLGAAGLKFENTVLDIGAVDLAIQVRPGDGGAYAHQP